MIITFLDNASNTFSLIKLFRKLNHTVCFSPFEKEREGRGNKVVQHDSYDMIKRGTILTVDFRRTQRLHHFLIANVLIGGLKL